MSSAHESDPASRDNLRNDSRNELRNDTLANPPQDGLHRQLSQRQLTMMAIGGAIGVGLFLGSTVTIQLAGPGVILSYLIGAAIALGMAYALAEMAVVHPVPGAF